MVFVAVPHVKMWRCAPSNETVVSSVVLCMGWTASLLQTHTKKKKKKRQKRKKTSQKRRTAGLTSTKSVRTPDQFCFICKALLLYCTLTTSCIDYENQMVKCETLFLLRESAGPRAAYANAFLPETLWDPGHDRTKTRYITFKTLGLAKYVFLYTGAFVASSKLIQALWLL